MFRVAFHSAFHICLLVLVSLHGCARATACWWSEHTGSRERPAYGIPEDTAASSLVTEFSSAQGSAVKRVPCTNESSGTLITNYSKNQLNFNMLGAFLKSLNVLKVLQK